MSSLCFRVLLIGDPCVGKTSLMQIMTKQAINNTVPTVGVDFGIYKFDDADIKRINADLSTPISSGKIHVWDASGHERFRTIISNYYRNLDALLVVCDLTNRRSFDRITYWLDDFLVRSEEDWHRKAVILIGNKSDLVRQARSKNAFDRSTETRSVESANCDATNDDDADRADAPVTETELRALSVRLAVPYLITSAKSYLSGADIIELLLEKLMDRFVERDRKDPVIIDLSQKRNVCCTII